MPSRLRRYDQPGHVHFWTISCYRRLSFFWHDPVKQVVIDGLRVLQARFNICLIGYVVMPEHVHILIFPHACRADEPTPVSRLLHAFKKFCRVRCADRSDMMRRRWSAQRTLRGSCMVSLKIMNRGKARALAHRTALNRGAWGHNIRVT